MYLSVVIPAYNEQERIGRTLSKICAFLRTKSYDYEIIVVDDGSSDSTVAEAAKNNLAEDNKIRIISNRSNKGKGFSVKRGILVAKGEYILFTDADLSTPIEELGKLSGYIDKGYDIVIGSRSVKNSDVRIHQPWHREKMGKVFNFFVKLFLLKEFNDTQCGFKFFKGNVARELAPLLKIDGFCFDAELLFLAKTKGYKIKEAGIVWLDSPKSKVKTIGSSINMLSDLLKIKSLHGY